MDVSKAMRERHSARRFSTKKVRYQDILKALDLARLAPLAGNIPSIRFILVSDSEKINKLAVASQQNFISQAQYVVAFCSDAAQTERSYGERGKWYATQQAGAAIENFLLKIEDLGLATCWIGAFSDEEVKSILKVPENIIVEALFPVGYEMVKKSKQGTKRELDQILYFDSWKNKYMQGQSSPRA